MENSNRELQVEWLKKGRMGEYQKIILRDPGEGMCLKKGQELQVQKDWF